MAGAQAMPSGVGPSVFTSLVARPDVNSKATLAALERHLTAGSASAVLNEHLHADALAAQQRTADWAAQRRKAGKETAPADMQRGKRRRIDEGYPEHPDEPVQVPGVHRPQRASGVPLAGRRSRS